MIVVSTDIYCSTRILYNVFLFFQLFALLPTLSGVDYKDWAAQMKPYLMSQGVFCVVSGKEDVDLDTYNAHNEKAIGTLVLKIAPTLCQKWQNIEEAKDIWKGLKNQFSTPSLTVVCGEFKKLMDTQIPISNHPAPSFAAINNHFALLWEYNYPINEQTQVMIVMAKLTPYMDVMTQLLNIKSIESTRDVKIDDMVMTTTGEGEAVVSSSVTTKVKKLASPPITLAELEEQTVLTWQKHT
jgi:hypothetical protein